MARHQARRRLWWNKKKTNQAKLESEVRTKGRTNVFRFSVFCRLKRKKKEFSLSFFSPTVALSQKRATSFLCDACERPSRAPVLLLACNLCIVCLSSMLSVTCLPLFSTYWARLWHLHSIFLCQLAYRFLFENAPFFCCCDDRVCLCVTMYDKRSSVFKVTVRAKETCGPGALVLVDVWSNLVMSWTPPYFLCPLFTQQWRSVIWGREKKKKRIRECVKREQEFHFAALLPGNVLSLHLSELPVSLVLAHIMRPYSCYAVVWELEGKRISCSRSSIVEGGAQSWMWD